jgi:hypothetical protein
MKHEAQVVRLPTEDSTNINLHLGKLSSKLTMLASIKDRAESVVSVAQYLYITVDQKVEPIKEGDYIIVEGRLMQAANNIVAKDVRKIIATTDTLLGKCFAKGVGSSGYERVIGIPQSFIKEYCDKGGIDEVLVEYGLPQEVKDRLIAGILIKADETDWVPKLNSDNTINISSIKEKMYDLNTLEQSCMYFANTTHIWAIEEVREWIKENL